MSSLKKRGNVYYIIFSQMKEGKQVTKTFSLGTTIKREAQKKQIEYDEKFIRGEIDPFRGWNPKKEIEQKRKKLRGKYMPLSDAADKFISERSQANKTTKRDYRRHLDMLMGQLGKTMPITEIIEEDIREFCFRSDLKPATQSSYLRHLKVFFRWLFEKKYLKENPAKNIKAAKVPKNISQKTITQKDLDKIFEAFDKYYDEMREKGFATKPQQQRLWFKPMIATIYYCGLRAKEAVTLTWNHVDLNEGFIRIINTAKSNTKSGLDRSIPIRAELLPWLKQWYKNQGKPEDGYVFPSATGFSNKQKMDSLALSKSFKKFVRLAKLPETITLHGLRHSCATDLLRKGVPINQVAKFLGHSTVQVTQIYEHLDETDLKRTIDNLE